MAKQQKAMVTYSAVRASNLDHTRTTPDCIMHTWPQKKRKKHTVRSSYSPSIERCIEPSGPRTARLGPYTMHHEAMATTTALNPKLSAAEP